MFCCIDGISNLACCVVRQPATELTEFPSGYMRVFGRLKTKTHDSKMSVVNLFPSAPYLVFNWIRLFRDRA